MRNQVIPTRKHKTRNITSTTYGLRRKYGSRVAGKRHLQYKHKHIIRTYWNCQVTQHKTPPTTRYLSVECRPPSCHTEKSVVNVQQTCYILTVRKRKWKLRRHRTFVASGVLYCWLNGKLMISRLCRVCSGSLPTFSLLFPGLQSTYSQILQQSTHNFLHYLQMDKRGENSSPAKSSSDNNTNVCKVEKSAVATKSNAPAITTGLHWQV